MKTILAHLKCLFDCYWVSTKDIRKKCSSGSAPRRHFFSLLDHKEVIFSIFCFHMFVAAWNVTAKFDEKQKTCNFWKYFFTFNINHDKIWCNNVQLELFVNMFLFIVCCRQIIFKKPIWVDEESLMKLLKLNRTTLCAQSSLSVVTWNENLLATGCVVAAPAFYSVRLCVMPFDCWVLLAFIAKWHNCHKYPLAWEQNLQTKLSFRFSCVFARIRSLNRAPCVNCLFRRKKCNKMENS